MSILSINMLQMQYFAKEKNRMKNITNQYLHCVQIDKYTCLDNSCPTSVENNIQAKTCSKFVNI